MAMSFSFILGLLAFILGVIGGVMSHTVPFVLLAAGGVSSSDCADRGSARVSRFTVSYDDDDA